MRVNGGGLDRLVGLDGIVLFVLDTILYGGGWRRIGFGAAAAMSAWVAAERKQHELDE